MEGSNYIYQTCFWTRGIQFKRKHIEFELGGSWNWWAEKIQVEILFSKQILFSYYADILLWSLGMEESNPTGSNYIRYLTIQVKLY
jgi:hypothetical protein